MLHVKLLHAVLIYLELVIEANSLYRPGLRPMLLMLPKRAHSSIHLSGNEGPALMA